MTKEDLSWGFVVIKKTSRKRGLPWGCVLFTLKTIRGDIVTNKLSIEPGAAFTGSCSMGAVVKDIKDAGKKEQKEKTA